MTRRTRGDNHVAKYCTHRRPRRAERETTRDEEEDTTRGIGQNVSAQRNNADRCEKGIEKKKKPRAAGLQRVRENESEKRGAAEGHCHERRILARKEEEVKSAQQQHP